jgi:hypothetical protein
LCEFGVTLVSGSPIRIIRNILLNKVLIITFFVSITAGESGYQANGGYLTHMDIVRNNYTEHWMGFYGVISNNTMTIENFNVKIDTNNSIQHIFTDMSIHEGDYLIITTSSSPPELSGFRAGNIVSVDEITGRGADSGSNTFTSSSSYPIPFSGTILDAPSIYIFDSREHYFREALLADSNGDPVFAVPIESHDLQNNKSHSFQLMLPQNGSITYYFFYLPSDTQ